MQLKYHFFSAIIFLLSKIPFWFYHLVAYLLGRFFYYTGLYRGKVVKHNLDIAFAQKTEKGRNSIRKKFYLHLADLLIESLKAYSLSDKSIKKRYKFIPNEAVQKLADEKKNIAVVLPHFNNWEWAPRGLNFMLERHNPLMLIMYKTLKDPVADSVARRTRGGNYDQVIMFPKDDLMKVMQKYHEQHYAVGFAADQSPANAYSCHWMNFLGLETGVFFGLEKFAKKQQLAVVYYHVKKVKRSFYEVEMEVISSNATEEPHTFITEQHMKLLEVDILENPQYWLWTHKRWKRKKPADFDEKRNAFKTKSK